MLVASDDPFAYFGMLDDEQRQELLRRYPDRKGYDDLRYPENYPAPNTTRGLGGLGSIFDIIKNQMPAPPTQNRGPILGQGPGKGRRQMPTGPISDNRMPSPTGPFEGGPAPLPTPYEPPVIGDYNPSDDALSRGENYTVGTRPDGTPVYRFDPDGMEYLKKSLENERSQGGGLGNVNQAPQMPTNDPLKLLQEALKQKQNREMPQKRPPPMRGDMRKKGGLSKGGLSGMIEKLAMQAAQKTEQPQMPTRPQPRGGMFGRIARSQDRGGSGGMLPRASNGPTPEQMRRIINGINVRGIGI